MRLWRKAQRRLGRRCACCALRSVRWRTRCCPASARAVPLIDETDRVVAEKRPSNDPTTTLALLLPWQDELKQSQKRLRLCAATSEPISIHGRRHDNNRSLLVADLVLIIRLSRPDGSGFRANQQARNLGRAQLCLHRSTPQRRLHIMLNNSNRVIRKVGDAREVRCVPRARR